VLPGAKYVLITRDGLDAAASAMQRWDARLDLSYTAAKARFVPVSDIPFYGVRFLSGRLGRRSSPSGRVSAWWGPRPHDYRELMASHPLDELCAIQWQRCVDQSTAALDDLGDDRLHRVRYEDFVTDPGGHVRDLAAFLGIAHEPPARVDGVVASSVGKGRSALGAEATSRLEGLVGSTLKELGYVA
jgi:hypothetical protein